MTPVSPTSSSAPRVARAPAPVPATLTDQSCRLPLQVLFLGAAAWLVVSAILGFLASMKFHAPDMFSQCAALSYGRLRPASFDALVYGFCIPSGLGVCFWLLATLGGSRLVQPWLVAVGAKIWNLGVLIGLAGILAGDATGFEGFEMPRYAAVFLFLGYVIMSLWGVVTFHQRRLSELQVSQWLLFAALFWFAWIFSTASLLLLTFPVRGVAQAVINWWYGNNLENLWIWLTGLAALFYFLPRLRGRPLPAYYMAMMSFWLLLLLGSWGGIPAGAPVPAWLPAISTVMTVMLVLPLLLIALILQPWLKRDSGSSSEPASRFFAFGAGSFLLAGLLHIVSAAPGVSGFLRLTSFNSGYHALNLYGFFGMTIFGAAYFILPRLLNLTFASDKMMRAHFWLSAIGVILMALPLLAAGILEGIKAHSTSQSVLDIARGSLMFFRISSMGELAMLAGNLLFLLNLSRLVGQFHRVRAVTAYRAVTEVVEPAGVRA